MTDKKLHDSLFDQAQRGIDRRFELGLDKQLSISDLQFQYDMGGVESGWIDDDCCCCWELDYSKVVRD